MLKSTPLRPTLLALALGACFPAFAQSNAEVLNELRALRERVTDLENKLKAAETKTPAAGQWGMTPEQARELNRITVKAEALEDARDAAGLRQLKISGYMDPTFIYNKAQNRSGFQFLNAVGDDGYNYDNSYFGAAVIDFQKETESGTRWRLTLAPNRGVGAVFDGQSPVHEASVSVPLGSLQQRLIAGQIPDWSGYEYLQPTLNKLITHNLLFDFTLPTAYTGVGMEITEGKWLIKTMLANMNASRKASGNNTPVLAYRVDYSRGEFQGFGFAGVHGKAANFRADDGVGNPVTFEPYSLADTAVNLFEVDGYFIRGDWTVQGQFSFGRQRNAAMTADPVTGELRDAKWWGVSALAAYKFTPRFEGTTRLDYVRNNKNGGGLLGYNFADGRNGLGPDLAGDPEVGANRTALTLGLSYLFDLNTTFKVEYRLDRASLPVFENVKDGTYKKSNSLFGASVLVSF
ncbi:MAG: DUF3138 family protein [Pseudomonadota bacterium]